MTKNNFERIIEKIKEKEELRQISSDVVSDVLREYLSINKINLENLSDKDLEIVKKDVRAKLRTYVGRFRKKIKVPKSNLKEEDVLEIVKNHRSTSERLESYEILINLIEKLNPKIVIDLGCGLNPLITAKKGMRYYAVDINEGDLEIVRECFNVRGIEGKVISKDIQKIDSSDLPEADLCLILKVFDVIEQRSHKMAEKILDTIRSKHFIISFSTKTLSGKPMNHPQRGWIERLLERKNWSFFSHKAKNEIFYVVKKSN